MCENITKKLNILDEKLKKYKFLSNNAIKIIAVVTMMIDHFAKITLTMWLINTLYPQIATNVIIQNQFDYISKFARVILPSIGRMAFPLFCFLLIEGFLYTRDKMKHLLLLTSFAFIAEIPFDISFYHVQSFSNGTFPFYYECQNVFFTLALGIVLLVILEEIEKKYPFKIKRISHILASLLALFTIGMIAELIRCDYGFMGILYIFAFYIFRNYRILSALSLIIIGFSMYGVIPLIYFILASLVVLFYNGTRGKLNLKYFFYVVYPVHLLIFFLIGLVLS